MCVLHAHDKKCGQTTRMGAWESVFLDTASVTQPAQPVSSGTPVHQLSPLLNRGIFTWRTRHGAFSALHYPLITLNKFCAHLKNTSSHWVKSNSSFSYWPTSTWVWTQWCGRGTSLHLAHTTKGRANSALSCRQNCIDYTGTFHHGPSYTFHHLRV